MFNFQNTYLSLPKIFYHLQLPTAAVLPQTVLINHALFDDMDLPSNDVQHIALLLSGNAIPTTWSTYCQAYAGHQFGYFNVLGDGRAILLGEHITSKNQRFDIQLKGAGATPYSRRGDGRATLKSMLREYLISEAMYHLQIPTSRSLAVIATGEKVYRESIEQGAVLTRIMKSHLRVGTFEYARYMGTYEEIKALADYTINRLYPDIKNANNPYQALFICIMEQQISLVTQWMRVGFIHGVMNTDNTSISGETFDYGPCAFMNRYNPQTVYSSIDTHARYAFGNQSNILKWNLTRLAEALIPLLDKTEKKALTIAKEMIDLFDEKWNNSYTEMMLSKIGLTPDSTENIEMMNQLCNLMFKHQMDFTNTFSELTYQTEKSNSIFNHPESQLWLKKWEQLTHNAEGLNQASKRVMEAHNPVIIPRNHLVEIALNQATDGDLTLFHSLCTQLKTPYTRSGKTENFLQAPNDDFETNYQTFCGT